MWLANLLRKLTHGPDVGETFRHYIGCYLFGTVEGPHAQPHYIAMPTSATALEAAVRNYLQEFVAAQSECARDEVQLVRSVLADLPQRLQQHLAGDMQQPFLSMPGVEVFVRKGMRERTPNDLTPGH